MPNIRPVPLSVKDPELFAFLQNLSLQIYVANQIPGESIVAESITADQIKAGTITADKVAFSVGGGSGNFVIRSATEPTQRPNADPLVAGDIWIDTSDGDRPYTYDGADFIRSFTIIDGGDITTGTIDANRIAAGSITATKLNVSTLAAISAALGTITAGLLRDAGSTFQVDLDNAILTITDTQAVPVTRIRIGKLDTGSEDYGIEVYDANGNLILGADGLGVDVVGSDQIQDDAVTGDHIGTGVISSDHIAALAITEAKVAASAITTAKIAAAAVAAGNLAASAVTEPAIAASAVTAAKIAAGEVQTTHLAAGAVTTAKIDALAVTASEIAAGAITTAKIAAGAVTATELAAGSVEADKIAAKEVGVQHLVVGSFDNLALNPGFEAGSAPHEFTATSGGSWSVTSGDQRSGSNCARFDPTGQTGSARINVNGAITDTDAHHAATVDDSFYAEVWCRANAVGSANRVRCRLVWMTAAGAAISITDGAYVTPTTTYQRATVTGQAPATTAYVVARVEVASDGFTNHLRIDDVYFRRMVAGDIVVDGAITADKIGAGEINTTHLNFTPATSTDVIATINASAEGIDISADRISISGSTTFASGYDPTTKAALTSVGAIIRSTTTPTTRADGTALRAGDMWIDTDDGNAPWVYSGAAFVRAYTSIDGGNIVTGTITAAQIASSAIGTDELAANSVTAAKIVAGTITATQIANSTITGGKIAGTTITAANIANGTITATQISDSTITAAKIVDATITGAKIANATITSGKISVSTLSSITANIGTITAGKLQNAGGTRYLDLTGTEDDFLHHEALELGHDGSATFSGKVAASSFAAMTAFFNGSIELHTGGFPQVHYTKLSSDGIGFWESISNPDTELGSITFDFVNEVIEVDGDIEVSGSLTAAGFFDSTVVSHRRYKDAIRDFAYDPESLMALRPREWVYSAEAPKSRVGKYGAGFVADEVPLIFAEENGEGYKQDRIIAQLVSGWKDNRSEIGALKARIAALEALVG